MEVYKSMSCAGGPGFFSEYGKTMEICHELVDTAQKLLNQLEMLASMLGADIPEAKAPKDDQKEMMSYTE